MSVTSPCHSLFVYGTLLRRCGHPMARFLAEHGRYRGAAKAPGRLYDLGRYPAAIAEHEEHEWIYGELYDIDEATLRALDDYESEESPQPAFFGRQLQQVTLETGDDAEAWVYWFHGPLPASAVPIALGKYEKFFRE